jgi:hypothetical protein
MEQLAFLTHNSVSYPLGFPAKAQGKIVRVPPPLVTSIIRFVLPALPGHTPSSVFSYFLV